MLESDPDGSGPMMEEGGEGGEEPSPSPPSKPYRKPSKRQLRRMRYHKDRDNAGVVAALYDRVQDELAAKKEVKLLAAQLPIPPSPPPPRPRPLLRAPFKPRKFRLCTAVFPPRRRRG